VEAPSAKWMASTGARARRVAAIAFINRYSDVNFGSSAHVVSIVESE
jgi:hypothetical protein